MSQSRGSGKAFPRLGSEEWQSLLLTQVRGLNGTIDLWKRPVHRERGAQLPLPVSLRLLLFRDLPYFLLVLYTVNMLVCMVGALPPSERSQPNSSVFVCLPFVPESPRSGLQDEAM